MQELISKAQMVNAVCKLSVDFILWVAIMILGIS